VAPVPLRATDAPAQKEDAGDAVASVAGIGFTVTVIAAVFVHPFPLVPVTVYVVVEEGGKETPFEMPPVQLYIVPPVPLRVTDVPAHIVDDGDAEAPTEGEGLTEMVTAAVLEHPPAFVPLTV
jgi:hypothetical protein